MVYQDQKRLLKMSALVLLVVSSLFVGVVLLQFFARQGKEPVNFIVAPSTALIVINDKEVDRGVNYLSPGEYSLSVTSDGFSSYSTVFEVYSGANNDIVVGLLPQTPEAERLASNDPAFLEFEGASGNEAREEGLAFESKNPVVAFLPFRSPDFRIDYRLSSEEVDSVVVQITAESKTNRDLALDEIKSWGFNPDDLEIEYLSWQ